MSPARFLLAFLLLGPAALADVVHLEEGGTLEGRVIDEGVRYTVVDRDRAYVVGKSAVARVEEAPHFMGEYAARLAALDKEDAEALHAFGVWLVQNDWSTRAVRFFEAAVEVDPDHRAAREALGYKLYEGQWVSPDELRRREGFVEFDGKWYRPNELAALRAELERNEDRRLAYEHAQNERRRINTIVQRFATFDPETREKAYLDLRAYAEAANSPQLRKFADDTKAYYDALVKHLCAKMKGRVDFRLTETILVKPVETIDTPLGAAIGNPPGVRLRNLVPRTEPVTIQLPQLDIVDTASTVEIPAGCG